MRVLISNARLAVRAGSELASLEFAEAYRRRGHEVALFTLLPGPLGAQYTAATGVPVLSLADQAVLRDFRPDLLHVHHWPTVLALEWLGVTAPWHIGFLGIAPPLECPPPLLPGTQVPWWTLNDVTQESVHGVPGWRASPHAVVGNWFDDSALPDPPAIEPRPIRRVVIVSNHFPVGTREAIDAVTATRQISITHVGMPHAQVPVDADLLRQFDAVITIGRTALLAMATGVPVLVLDHFGGDGWVTADHLPDLARHNFSGRWQRLEPTPERLAAWLDAPPGLEQLEAVRGWAHANAALSLVMDRLSTLWPRASASPPSDVFGRGALAVGELLCELNDVRRRDLRLQSQPVGSPRAVAEQETGHTG